MINPATAPSRIRPVTVIEFHAPIAGPSGCRLVSYVWKWRPEEFVDAQGEDRVKRVSNWDEALTSEETGKEIVHQFTVIMPDGESRAVSAESVPVLLGFPLRSARHSLSGVVNAAKTLAKLKMALATAEWQFEENARIEARVAAMELPPVINSGRAYPSSPTSTAIQFNMGDAFVVQHTMGEIEVERLKCLTGCWRAKREVEQGLVNVSPGPCELRRRIAKAQRKLDQLLTAGENATV